MSECECKNHPESTGDHWVVHLMKECVKAHDRFADIECKIQKLEEIVNDQASQLARANFTVEEKGGCFPRQAEGTVKKEV